MKSPETEGYRKSAAQTKDKMNQVACMVSSLISRSKFKLHESSSKGLFYSMRLVA